MALSPPLFAGQDASVIFLVRHAEKTDDGRDPPLSDAGRQRVSELAHVLRDAGITRVYSTDYVRTRDTAAPVASVLGVEVLLYDPRELENFAMELKRTTGRHLVVGHSNTTPELTELLGGDGGTDIDEPGEYDRLYVVTLASDGGVRTLLLRYGKPFSP